MVSPDGEAWLTGDATMIYQEIIFYALWNHDDVEGIR